MSSSRWLFLNTGLMISAAVCGCGGGETPSAPTAATQAPAEKIDVPTPEEVAAAVKPAGVTASIDSPSAAKSTDQKTAEKSNTPGMTADGKQVFPDDEATKTLKEIQQLRIAAVPTEIEQAKAARKERNDRIVEMATRVITLTMNEETRKPQFYQAIGQLLEARFQNALVGGKEDADALYADVQALNDRDPKSIPAAEGVYYAAKFAHTKAGMLGKSQPVWFETLSRWAREFGDRFPEQQKRATSLLFGAARSCEMHAHATQDKELSKRLMTECRLCYTALSEKFPKSEQGQEAIASLRRLELTGQPLSQFSGPTAEGGFVSSDEFPGKPTLIYFWDSESDEFTEEVLPAINKIRTQLPAERLRIIGVALDEEESTMNSYMEQHEVPGQQIFFTNAEQRSWNSPLIRFWGIAESPSIWIVDSKGVVLSTSAKVDELVPLLQQALKK